METVPTPEFVVAQYAALGVQGHSKIEKLVRELIEVLVGDNLGVEVVVAVVGWAPFAGSVDC